MPLEDPYFDESRRRRSLRDALVKADARWRSRREHANRYRNACVKEWDSRGIPVTLDLHGFKAATAKDVLREFTTMVRKAGLPCWGVIFGTGEVLGDVVAEVLDAERRLEIVRFEGHCYVEDDRGDDDAWPGCGLELAPQVQSLAAAASRGRRLGCRTRLALLFLVLMLAMLIAHRLGMF